MKTVVTITHSEYNNEAYEIWSEAVSYYLQELNIHVERKNLRYTLPHYTNMTLNQPYKSIELGATGYSQSDWQSYIIYYEIGEEKKPEFKWLIEELRKTFTHKNQYVVSVTQETKIDGKLFKSETLEIDSIVINDIEFPDGDDVRNAYENHIGFTKFSGSDINEVRINVE